MNIAILKSDSKTSRRAAGALGATALACVACCAGAPFIVPLLGWSGLSGMVALSTHWYLGAASAIVMGLAIGYAMRRRRLSACNAGDVDKPCNCETACPR